MVGINVEMLSNIINNLESQIENSNRYLNKMVEVTKDLDRCYYTRSRSDIKFLFSGLGNNEQIIRNIKTMLQSYPKILRSVKTSYVKQDQIFSEEINHIISKI